MSIPCQQLARVYDRYGLSIPVGYEIREVLPDAENVCTRPGRLYQAQRQGYNA